MDSVNSEAVFLVRSFGIRFTKRILTLLVVGMRVREGVGGGGVFGALKSHHIELSMSMMKNFEYYFRVITCIQG